jgi:hypothetical protein
MLLPGQQEHKGATLFSVRLSLRPLFRRRERERELFIEEGNRTPVAKQERERERAVY